MFYYFCQMLKTKCLILSYVDNYECSFNFIQCYLTKSYCFWLHVGGTAMSKGGS